MRCPGAATANIGDRSRDFREAIEIGMIKTVLPQILKPIS
jgi:hypothetical protein